jgi:hypothetical protein
VKDCNRCISFVAVHESAHGRFCCKSLSALLIKNSFGVDAIFGLTRSDSFNVWFRAV